MNAAALLATDFADSWWKYVALLLAVAASWAGVRFIGATLSGAAVTLAADPRAMTAFFAAVLLLIKDFFSTDMLLSPFV